MWRKVWRDLAHYKSRTALVVLATATGLFALGVVFGMRDAVRSWLAEDYRAAAPAHVTFWPSPFDQDVIDVIRREPYIADAEGRSSFSVRWRLAGETDWHDGTLIARTDYRAQRINRAGLVEGDWPARHTLGVERQLSRYFDVPLGASVIVEYWGYERDLPVMGILCVHNEAPPQFGGPAFLFATPDTVTWLTGQEGLTTLDVRLASFSAENLDEAVERIHDRMERMGLPIYNTVSQGTDAHMLQDQVNAALLVLIGLALGLGGFLIANTTHAVIAQQVWQIGVMKVVGGTFNRIVSIYLVTGLVYGGVALLPAVPLAAIAAHLAARPIFDVFNVAAGPSCIRPAAVSIQVVVGLTVPLLAASIPTLGSARISPHQAIGSYGLGTGFGRSWLDRLIGAVRCLPRPLALSLRSTFRRKTCVALMLSTLTLCGMMFIVAMSVRSSLDRTIEMRMQDFGDDVLVRLTRSYPTAQVVSATEGVSGVAKVEVWNGAGTTALLPNGKERYVYLWALPPGLALFRPRVVGGRWLHPGDDRAIVMSSKSDADDDSPGRGSRQHRADDDGDDKRGRAKARDRRDARRRRFVARRCWDFRRRRGTTGDTELAACRAAQLSGCAHYQRRGRLPVYGSAAGFPLLDRWGCDLVGNRGPTLDAGKPVAHASGDAGQRAGDAGVRMKRRHPIWLASFRRG